jgi:hypothetical protein
MINADLHQDDPPLLLPLNRMARRLRVTIAWLRSEADAGRVPCLKAGKQYLFAPDAVAKRLAGRCEVPEMSAILSETRLTLNDLAREQDVCISTASRWCLIGAGGHRLESCRLGGRVITSREAFQRWLAKINSEAG